MNQPYIIEFPTIGTSSLGYLTIAEDKSKIPFDILRVYWTYYAPHEVIRGHHAHKDLQQIIFAISGSIKLELESKQGEKNVFLLDNPKLGLYIPPLTWRTMQFSHNAVLLCLASMEYNESDYIRNYELFKK